MSKQTEPRCVWLWNEPKDTIAISTIKPQGDGHATSCTRIYAELAGLMFGDIPPGKTAWLVDTSRNQYRCPRCEKWRDNDICQCADREHGLRAEKTRAFVVEEIPLADAQSPGKLQSH